MNNEHAVKTAISNAALPPSFWIPPSSLFQRDWKADRTGFHLPSPDKLNHQRNLSVVGRPRRGTPRAYLESNDFRTDSGAQTSCSKSRRGATRAERGKISFEVCRIPKPLCQCGRACVCVGGGDAMVRCFERSQSLESRF